MARNDALRERAETALANSSAPPPPNSSRVNAPVRQDSLATSLPPRNPAPGSGALWLLERWETEKQKYELKALGPNVFAYMLRQDARGSAPPHWVCVRCLHDGHLEIIELARHGARKYECPRCNATIGPSPAACADAGRGGPKWLD